MTRQTVVGTLVQLVTRSRWIVASVASGSNRPGCQMTVDPAPRAATTPLCRPATWNSGVVDRIRAGGSVTPAGIRLAATACCACTRPTRLGGGWGAPWAGPVVPDV